MAASPYPATCCSVKHVFASSLPDAHGSDVYQDALLLGRLLRGREGHVRGPRPARASCLCARKARPFGLSAPLLLLSLPQRPPSDPPSLSSSYPRPPSSSSGPPSTPSPSLPPPRLLDSSRHGPFALVDPGAAARAANLARDPARADLQARGWPQGPRVPPQRSDPPPDGTFDDIRLPPVQSC